MIWLFIVSSYAYFYQTNNFIKNIIFQKFINSLNILLYTFEMAENNEFLYIKLISSDNKSFEITKEIADVSGTLKLFIENFENNMNIKGNVKGIKLKNTESNKTQKNECIIKLPIKAEMLAKCIDFMQRKVKNKKEFFKYKIKDEEVIELLDVASYLRI
ncbi:hypothetical protein EHP00_1899 [Ecytonucleospora hepatopenaei]|uniref:SKP1 component POZ domain-containing protein n=1 Tax=Ecytonucleospora hepatopenaei TaxID=646526 RepID=A0A1W0E3H2_9MICR|nr:hypothetical protein EHP00_1899 [Ecytonucleospora hepatopenaei]